MKIEPIPRPEFLREVKTPAADHEVFLAFNSDWHAVAFSDWLAEEGFKRFVDWATCRKDDYQ